MRRWRNGTLLWLSLGLASCRATVPPKIDICIGDGFGGADCILKDGSRQYIPPSGTRNFWMTTQEDMARFSAWCYDADNLVIDAEMHKVRIKAQGL